MSTNWQDLARKTLEGAEGNTMTFPESVKLLTEAGFDGYAVDFRRAVRIYYRPAGETLELTSAWAPETVAERFDPEAVKSALREAQMQVPGYTYKGFCAKVTAAGCAGYVVSLLGRRVLYYGRTCETHTEYFPGTRPDAP